MAKKNNILLILRVWASSALEIYCGGIPNMAETIDTPRMSLEGMWGKMRTQLHSLLLKGQISKRGEVDSRWTWTLIWQPEKILFHIGARHTDYTEVIQSPKSMRDSLRFFSSPCVKLCDEWRVIGETPWNCYGPPLEVPAERYSNENKLRHLSPGMSLSYTIPFSYICQYMCLG